MSAPAPKQAETEFDDLLGQLVDELAMTPASESAVQLVPEPPPPPQARVDSTQHMAAEAAAAAGAAAAAAAQTATPPPASGNLVKIVGIITGSLTVVALTALAVFASTDEPSAAQDEPIAAAAAVDHERLDEIARAQRAALAQVEAERMAAERAEIAARTVRIEAGLLQDELEAQKAAAKPKTSKRGRSKSKPKPKKPTFKPSDSFDDL